MEKLAKHEESMGDFYLACANIFPDNRDFWQKISGEEKMHAHWLYNLKSKIENNIVYLETEKFTERSITNSMQYLEEEKRNLEGGKYIEEQAFFIALDLENALIESGNLRLFSSDSSEVKHFLNFLLEETEKHREMIKARIK